LKEITYNVTLTDITPKDIIEIGFAGEHLSKRVIFNLSDELSNEDEYEYCLYITNGGGEFFATDHLILSENSIYYDLPNYVTAISGICSLQLVIKHNEKVIFTYPAKLRFLPSSEKTTGAINYLSEISDALSICKNSAKKAQEYLNAVNDNSAEFNRINGDISNALDYILELQEYYIGGEN